MKGWIFVSAVFLGIGYLIYWELKQPNYRYSVLVTFCDNRPSKIVYTNYQPSNSDISNFRKAVPEWHGMMNVCDLMIIKRDSI